MVNLLHCFQLYNAAVSHPSVSNSEAFSSSPLPSSNGSKLRQETEAVTAAASLPRGAPLGPKAAGEGAAQEGRPVAGAKGVPGGSQGIPRTCPAADGSYPPCDLTTTPAAAEGHCCATASAQLGSSGDVGWRRWVCHRIPARASVSIFVFELVFLSPPEPPGLRWQHGAIDGVIETETIWLPTNNSLRVPFF